jgi:Transposase family tnp2
MSSVVAQIAIFLAVSCSVLMGVARRGGDYILGLIHKLLYLAYTDADYFPDGKPTLRQENILHQIPLSMDQALSKFNLDGKTTIYAVCPSCHCTYAPQSQLGSLTKRYPTLCSYKIASDANECKEPLLKQSGRPIKTFVYHSFHDYLSGLLTRKDLEDVMDKTCDNLMASIHTPPPDCVTSFFEAEFMRSFEGPQRGTLFVDRGNEGRYVFALNIDFFNVGGMRIRGASTSCGIMSMTCLNIPLVDRNKSDNVYLAGIIGGGVEPHLTQLNHYQRPLVDDLEISWRKGVRFSRTASHPEGRTTRCAIAAAVCDLPAARKVAGLSSHRSYFYCSVCECCHLSTLGRTDHEKWVKINDNELRGYAERWRDGTLAEQKDIFHEHGIRWSEFWRLSYWRPSRQLAVDVMHCILEGLAQNHTRRVLKLTTKSASERAEPMPAFEASFLQFDPDVHGSLEMSDNDIVHISVIHNLLTASLDDDTNASEHLETLKKRLSNKNLKALTFVYDDLKLSTFMPQTAPVKMTRLMYAESLVNWVCYFSLAVPCNVDGLFSERHSRLNPQMLP